MLFYSPVITERLRFIVDFFNKELFDEQMIITNDLQIFRDEPNPKINYGRLPVSENEFRVCPVSLLMENNIIEQELNIFEVFGHKGLFPTYGGDFPFDIFSASFYLMVRYEEYLPYEKDFYGRYAYLNSVAYREKFLDFPLVNFWIIHFRRALLARFPAISLKKKTFSFLPTYDIDIAFSYSGKGRGRNLGGALKSFFTFRPGALWRRIQVLRGKRKDPFDTYEWLDKLHNKFKLAPRYFFLLAGKSLGYDKNILPTEPILQDLVRFVSEKNDVGIHPSWQSFEDPELLREEINTLNELTGVTTTHSRQHYIRFTLPGTFRELVEAGITDDYSMGYGSINGFRASVSSSFYFYDLLKEEKTALMLHPFCFMDANAYYEEKLNVESAFEQLAKYQDIISKVNGNMVTIWHNQFLGTDRAFQGWKELYEKFISEKIVKMKAMPVDQTG
ncbi:MAG: polysaccharide deacetylase family protein [Chitinophagaceae bacterium]